ncbi:hypothetical protein [Lysobacter sp. Root690]|uniref:hypothetical protein n=1 Tax=Lysobacter sp. Root690 TaxID=1736588 RepID=UPI0012F8F418|nr:hypothetical protein [Lysobacter sp. Root690]
MGSIAIAHSRGGDAARGDGAFSIDVSLSARTHARRAHPSGTNVRSARTPRPST